MVQISLILLADYLKGVKMAGTGDEVKTTFTGKAGSGGLTLYANHLKKGKEFYGRFSGEYLSNENVIARVQKKNPGTDELIISTSETYLKREILEAVAEGKAVSLLGLGTISLSAGGSCTDDSSEEISEMSLHLKFTPGQELKAAAAKVSIGNVIFSDTTPVISKITDWFTGKVTDRLTAGKNVLIEGKRLKIGDDFSGLFLAPSDEKGSTQSDESLWIDCTALIRVNKPKKIDFYLPPQAESGKNYRIVIKTNYINGKDRRKTPLYAYSGVITVVSEDEAAGKEE